MEWFLIVYIVMAVVGLWHIMTKLEANGWRPVVDKSSVGTFVFAYVVQAAFVAWSVATYGWLLVTFLYVAWNVANFFLALYEQIVYGGSRYSVGNLVFALVVFGLFVTGFALL